MSIDLKPIFLDPASGFGGTEFYTVGQVRELLRRERERLINHIDELSLSPEEDDLCAEAIMVYVANSLRSLPDEI